MPMYSTYKQYWQAHEEARDEAIEVGGELRDAVGRRDGIGRELREAEGIAPEERVTELREDYAQADGRVEKLQKEFGDAQTKVSAIELDAASADPSWAGSLEEGIAPDGSRRGEKSGLLAELRDLASNAREAAQEFKLGKNIKEAVIDPLKEGIEASRELAKEGLQASGELAKAAGEMAKNALAGGAMLGLSVGVAAQPSAEAVHHEHHHAKAGVEKTVDVESHRAHDEVHHANADAHKHTLGQHQHHQATADAEKHTQGQKQDHEHHHAKADPEKSAQEQKPDHDAQHAKTDGQHDAQGRNPEQSVSNPQDAPKGPDGPDPLKEQQKFTGVQRRWDDEERKRDAQTAQQADAQATNWKSETPPKVDDPIRPPPEAPPVADHPGSLTAFEHPLGESNESYAGLQQAFGETGLQELGRLPAGVESSSSLTDDPMETSREASPQQVGSDFRDPEHGGLGVGPSSYASTQGPDIPGPLLELNDQPPPPPPPPPAEEEPQKGRSR